MHASPLGGLRQLTHLHQFSARITEDLDQRNRCVGTDASAQVGEEGRPESHQAIACQRCRQIGQRRPGQDTSRLGRRVLRP